MNFIGVASPFIKAKNIVSEKEKGGSGKESGVKKKIMVIQVLAEIITESQVYMQHLNMASSFHHFDIFGQELTNYEDFLGGIPKKSSENFAKLKLFLRY